MPQLRDELSFRAAGQVRHEVRTAAMG
jgi:hypothetical protein